MINILIRGGQISGLSNLTNFTSGSAGGDQRIPHQHRDRHRSDAARHRRYRSRDRDDIFEIGIADDPVPFFAFWIVDAGNSDVDDDSRARDNPSPAPCAGRWH